MVLVREVSHARATAVGKHLRETGAPIRVAIGRGWQNFTLDRRATFSANNARDVDRSIGVVGIVRALIVAKIDQKKGSIACKAGNLDDFLVFSSDVEVKNELELRDRDCDEEIGDCLR